jgi:ABC-type amino acid transport substrate-binding protein
MTGQDARAPLEAAFITEYPYSYRDGSGALTGFDIALLEEVARRMGAPATDWTEIQWNEVLPALGQGRFEVIVTGLARHADRMAVGLPSEPLYYVRSMGFVPKGNPDGIHSIEDMARISAPVGSILGSLELKVMKRVLGRQALGYAEEPEMWADLEAGVIRAVTFAEEAGLGHIARNPEAEIECVDGFDFPTLPETGWFFRKDDTALKAIVDPHIRAIKEEGVLAAILARFGYPIELALPPGAAAQSDLEPDL